MAYYTNLGPKSGPIMYRNGYSAIGVLKARDNNMPIGVALGTGWDHQGVALWRLSIGDDELPGPWIVVNREFKPAQ